MEKTTGLKAGCSRDPRQLLKETCGQGTTEYAILVGVLVVILDMAVVAVAQFVAYGVPFQDMHQMHILESDQRPENVALVDGIDFLFQLHERERAAGLLQSTGNEQAVGRHHKVIVLRVVVCGRERDGIYLVLCQIPGISSLLTMIVTAGQKQKTKHNI